MLAVFGFMIAAGATVVVIGLVLMAERGFHMIKDRMDASEFSTEE